jgi:hypothetical protein
VATQPLSRERSQSTSTRATRRCLTAVTSRCDARSSRAPPHLASTVRRAREGTVGQQRAGVLGRDRFIIARLAPKLTRERLFSIRCLLQGHDDMMARVRRSCGCGGITPAERRQVGRPREAAQDARRPVDAKTARTSSRCSTTSWSLLGTRSGHFTVVRAVQPLRIVVDEALTDVEVHASEPASTWLVGE